jgi:geranylgeranyl diphosphate synthase, type II
MLDRVIPYREIMSKVEAAARYSLDLEPPGIERASRARPVFTIMLAEAYQNPFFTNNVKRICLVTEAIHCASLILDDLKCMDDAKLRRGRPTTHLIYKESNSIMASQRLINASIDLIAKNSPERYKESLITESTRVGNIMMNAQAVDLAQSASTEEEVKDMYQGKSGELLGLAVRLGTFHTDGTSLKRMNEWPKSKAYSFGRQLGFTYQLIDDLKDLYLAPKEAGKDTGKDSKKRTFINLLSPQESIELALKEKEKAKRFVQGKPKLEALIDMLLNIPELFNQPQPSPL